MFIDLSTRTECKQPENQSVSRTYVESFTIHGLSKVFLGKPLERLFWFLTLFGVLSFVGYKVYGDYVKYYRYEYRTEIRIDDVEKIIYPALILCSSVFDDYSPICYKNNDTYCLGKKRPSLRSGNFDLFELNETAHQKYSSCVKLSPQQNPTFDFADSLHGTGIIYAISHDYPFLRVSVADDQETITQVGPNANKIVKMIEPGFYNLEIESVTVTNRLHAPYAPNCSDGGHGVNVFGGNYTKQKCYETCLLRAMIRECGGVVDQYRKYMTPSDESLLNSTRVTKTVEEVRECIRTLYLHHKCRCPLPCYEVTYQYRLTNNSELILSNAVGDFSFRMIDQNKRITEVTQVPIYTSDDFFADIGSWLGLLAGVSLLSLVEIFVFICTAIKERFI